MKETREDIAKIISNAFKNRCPYNNACRNCEYSEYGDLCQDYMYADALILNGYCKKNDEENKK